MKAFALFAAVLVALALAGTAYAAVPAHAPRAHNPPMAEMNEMNGPHGPHGPGTPHGQPLIMPRETNGYRVMNEKALKELRERFGGRIKNFERIIRRAEERRAAVERAVRVSRHQIEHWKMISERYRHVATVVRETARMYELKLREWLRVRAMFQEGNITEAEYLAKTKDMVVTAIQAMIERLESLASSGIIQNTADINAEIQKLETLKSEVNDVNDLTVLRTMYKEQILPELHACQETFFHYYAFGTIEAANSIVARLDVAAARLARYVDRAKALGVYDENIDSKVTAVFAEIEAIKEELNTLQTQLDQNTITPMEYVQKIRELRADLFKVYKDIRDIVRDLIKQRMQYIRTHRVRVRREVNAEVNG